jgi:protein PhnA
MENTDSDGKNFIYPNCSHEWSANTQSDEVADKRIHKDVHGNILNDGDTATL